MWFRVGIKCIIEHCSQSQDTETQLYYCQSRYYDPALGRFINADDVDYLGAGGDLTSYNLFAYCGNNPVMGYDPTGHWDWGREEQAALGTTVLIVGLALLLAAPTGGSSLAFGALAISSSTAVAAGSAMAVTGTVMVGDAIAASIREANGKPTSRNQMQKQVESGKAPNEVDRVDPPHNDVDNSQNHIHFKDGTAMCLSIRNCIKRAPKSTVPGQHRFGF